MDNSWWYAIAIATIAATAFCVYLFIKAIDEIKAHTYITFYFVKYLYYHRVFTYLRWSSTITWFDVIAILIYLIGNAICLSVNVTSRKALVQRTGLLSTVNLIPLALGGHMNIVINRLGLGLEAYQRIHRWIGRTAVVEGLLHAILSLTSQTPNLHNDAQRAAIELASAMALITAASTFVIRRRFYETFLNAHQALGVAILVGVAIHAPGKLSSTPILYVLVAGAVWIMVRLVRFVQILCRSLRNGRRLCRAVVWLLPGAVQVHVKVGKPWKYRAGQYAYLCIPSFAFGEWMQSHPYFISWWYKDHAGDDVVVFIIECHRGFSETLRQRSSGDLVLGIHLSEGKGRGPRLRLATDLGEAAKSTELGALLEGPYGQELHLDDYGTVILFATGIGIAGQLPYLKQLLEDSHNWNTKAKRIVINWEVESEQHLLWVGNWMSDLLLEDTASYILDIRVFVANSAEYGEVVKDGTHGRMQVAYRDLDVEDSIRTELGRRKGKTVVLRK